MVQEFLPLGLLRPTKNVAWWAYFDTVSSLEEVRAWGSHFDHRDGGGYRQPLGIGLKRSALHVRNAPPSVIEARHNRNAIGEWQEQQRGDYRRAACSAAIPLYIEYRDG